MKPDMPWLNELKRCLQKTTQEAAREYWASRDAYAPPYFNYRLEQVRQAERDARRIWSYEGGNIEVILAAVWIADIFIPQFYGPNHPIKAAKWALQNLGAMGFPVAHIDSVAQAVALHERKTMDISEKMMSARVVWDAVHVSRLGPANTVNFVFSHMAAEFQDMLRDSPDYPENSITLEAFVPALLQRRPQFYQGDFYYFDHSRTLARERINAMRQFVDCLERQVWLRDLEEKVEFEKRAYFV